MAFVRLVCPLLLFLTNLHCLRASDVRPSPYDVDLSKYGKDKNAMTAFGMVVKKDKGGVEVIAPVELLIYPDEAELVKGQTTEVTIVSNRTVPEADDFMIVKVNLSGCFWPTASVTPEYTTLVPSVNLFDDEANASTYSVVNEVEKGAQGEPDVLARNVTLFGLRIGQCKLTVYECDLPEMSLNEKLCEHYDVWKLLSNDSVVRVLREEKPREMFHIFRISTLVTILVTYFCMGCMLNQKNILEDVRRPIAPLLGVVAQYLFMPVVRF